MSVEDPKGQEAIDHALAALPERDVDPWRAGRIRHHALAELGRASGRPIAAWRVVYDRVLEPALVAGVTLVYLRWAVEVINRLHGG